LRRERIGLENVTKDYRRNRWVQARTSIDGK
jgi:hypothetical protein